MNADLDLVVKNLVTIFAMTFEISVRIIFAAILFSSPLQTWTKGESESSRFINLNHIFIQRI